MAVFDLQVTKLTKSFGETRALRSCTFVARAGEAHSVLGENGSGKSTLVKILSGVLPPDSGEVQIGGTRIKQFTPKSLQRLGVAAVFQEVLVAPNRSVVDNIFLGHASLVGRGRCTASQRAAAQRVLSVISSTAIDLDTPVEMLPLAQRQVVTIARALTWQPRLLILDEATSALGVEDRGMVFDTVRRLTADGVLVIFISHHLDEILELSEVVTVLRSGESVADVARNELDADKLLRLMSPSVSDISDRTHRPVSNAEPPVAATKPSPSGPAAPLLQVSNLRLRPEAAAFPPVVVNRGEIVGLIGLDGHGQEEFLEIISGLRKPLSGTVDVTSSDGTRRSVDSLFGAARHGVVYLPRDRKVEGILPSLSVLTNFAMSAIALGKASRGSFLRRRYLRASWTQFRQRLGIIAESPSATMTSLSGGNQQKVLLARCMLLAPSVMLLNDPTRGVDAATKLEFYEIFRNTVHDGRAIVLLSTDLQEISALCDRVLVFHNGAIQAELAQPHLSVASVLEAMFGR